MYGFKKPPKQLNGMNDKIVQWYAKQTTDMFVENNRKIIGLDEISDMLPPLHKKYARQIIEWLVLHKMAYPKIPNEEWYFFKEFGAEKIEHLKNVNKRLQEIFKKR